MSSFSIAIISASNHSPKYSDQTQSPTLNRDIGWGGGGKEDDIDAATSHVFRRNKRRESLTNRKQCHFLAPISQMEDQIFNQLLGIF